MTSATIRTAALVTLAAAALAAAALPARAAEEKVLNIYNWSDYIADDTIANFEKETGIKVHYDNYDANEILHAKLMVTDGAAYIGSANLDIRSLHLNYELMVRLSDKTVVDEAHDYVERILEHCRQVKLSQWLQSQTFWDRWKRYWAHLLLRHVDSFVALRQFHSLRD